MKLTNLFESKASLFASYRFTKAMLESVTLQDLSALTNSDAGIFQLKGLKENHDYLAKLEYDEVMTKGDGFLYNLYIVPLTKAAQDRMSFSGIHIKLILWLNYRLGRFQCHEGNSIVLTLKQARKLFPDHFEDDAFSK